MSILVYRDDSGADVEIKNPSMDDWSACCEMIAKRHKDEFHRVVLREIKQGNQLLDCIGE